MKSIKKIIAFALVCASILSLPGSFVLADEDAPAEGVVATAAEEGAPAEELPEESAALEAAPDGENEPDAGTESPEPAETDATGEGPELGEEAAEGEAVPDAEAALTDGEPFEEEAEPAPRAWVAPGNTDLEILGGGLTVWDGDAFYYSDGGIWYIANGSTRFVTSESGSNLNLADGYVYYTLSGGTVRRTPASGGTPETVYAFGADIAQLYVMGTELRFLSNGRAYSYDTQTERLETLSAPANAVGLIPTRFGNLYLTGSVRDYTLWAETDALLPGVEHCYTDGNWLVVDRGGTTRQAYLYELFDGVCDLRAYALHQEGAYNGLSDEEQLENEAAFFESEQYERMEEALGETLDGADYYTATSSTVKSTDATSSTLTSNQKNIILRARQMAEVKWTPLYDRYSWGGNDSSYVSSNSSRNARVIATDDSYTLGVFKAGKTYQGIPYSQAVYTGYVGYAVSIDGFVQAVNNSSSNFYKGYSNYSRTAPYYGSDCSGFVSWAWNLSRYTCTGLVNYGNSSRISNSLANLQIGDSLNNPNSHVVLITDIGRDASGNVVSVEITEQTPCKMRVTCYGALIPGKHYQNVGSLSYINTYYFGGGYSIYRRSESKGSVGFTKSSAVNLEETGFAPAPTVSVAVNADGTAKVVTISHSSANAVIYYTTDGSEPQKGTSPQYMGPFEVTKETTVRAIADCGSTYTGSYAVTFVVSVTRAEKPFVVLAEGEMQEEYVSSGARITLMNVKLEEGKVPEQEDKIFYTTDGSEPTKNSTPVPAEGILVTKDMTLKAVALSTRDLISEPVELNVRVGSFHTIEMIYGDGGYVTGSYSVLRGTDAAIRITPLEHYVITDVLVDGKSVGVVESYTFSSVDKDHTIEARFEVDIPFKDVSDTAWFADQVMYAYANNLFAGTSETKFSPYDNMTRGMFITVLGRFAGEGRWTDLGKWSGRLGVTNGSAIAVRESKTTADISQILTRTGAANEHIAVLSDAEAGYDNGQWYRVSYGGVTGYMRATMPDSTNKTLLKVYNGRFTDLADGAYYTGYAQWANIEGVMYGVSDTAFGTNQFITRQDICVLLYRYLTSYRAKSVPTTATSFADDASITGYAKDAVYAMKSIGVVSGKGGNMFDPLGYATRAEVATMFYNLSAWLAKNP